MPTTNRRPQNETAHVWTCMHVDKKLCLYTRHWKLCPDAKMNEKRHLHQPRQMILGTSWSNRCNFPGQPIENKYDHSNLKKTPCRWPNVPLTISGFFAGIRRISSRTESCSLRPRLATGCALAGSGSGADIVPLTEPPIVLFLSTVFTI